MAVKIRRERPDQRRHHRVTAPMFVICQGHRLRATNWSLGGLRVDEFPGDMPTVGDRLSLHLSLPFQGFNVGFDVILEVVRLEAGTRMFAGKFVEIGERELELMTHFLEELVRGSMQHSEVADTIQRIDVPVTPASTKPDVNPAKEVPVRRWPVRTLVMTGIYGFLGFVVFGLTALLLYSNFFRIEVQTAVIAAPVETITAAADGQLKLANVKTGEDVRAGDVLMTVVDNLLQREIDLADIAVKEQKAKLGSLKQKHLEELEKIKAYAMVEMKNIRQTKLHLESLTEQLDIAERNERRQRQLLDKGFATETKYDEARKQVVDLRKQLEVRRIELNARIDLSEMNVGKRMYSGNETIGNGDLQQSKLADIEADISLGEHEIQLAQQKHIAFLNQRERQSIRSPFDGTILELPRVNESNVRRGDVLAMIEQRKLRQVAAYLNQDEIAHVGLGDEASIYIPALRETLKARVTRVDRTTGFVEEEKRAQNPGYRWRGQVDRSGRVLLEFTEPHRVRDIERYRSGLPVVVVFPNRSANPLLAAIRQRFVTAVE